MIPVHNEVLLDLESRKCFEYFRNETNMIPGSPGYGLVRDRAPSNAHVSSIAATGFALTALTIGVRRGWISWQAAYERTMGTLHTLLNHAEHVNGFFYHFLDLYSAKRIWNCEVSNIDSAILLCGAISAGEFFGPLVLEKAYAIYERMNWTWFLDRSCNRFYLGYTKETGFFGHWDSYAEQLMMYFLALASPKSVNTDTYYAFERYREGYKDIEPFIYSYTGALFTYQFSHAWFDLRNKTDQEGIDWWENSIRATKAARLYAMEYESKFKTFGPSSWGLTACDGPSGYSGMYGSPPRMTSSIHTGNDGTVPPCGAIGSIVFTPVESMTAMAHYAQQPGLWGMYGFKDAYNRDQAWIASDCIGIDKGISLLMIENYRSGFVWDLFMKNESVRTGMKKAGLQKKIKKFPVIQKAMT